MYFLRKNKKSRTVQNWIVYILCLYYCLKNMSLVCHGICFRHMFVLLVIVNIFGCSSILYCCILHILQYVPLSFLYLLRTKFPIEHTTQIFFFTFLCSDPLIQCMKRQKSIEIHQGPKTNSVQLYCLSVVLSGLIHAFNTYKYVCVLRRNGKTQIIYCSLL